MKQNGTLTIQSIKLKQLINNLIHCYGVPGKQLESCDQCFFKDRSTKDCQCRDKLVMTTIIALYDMQVSMDNYVQLLQDEESATSIDAFNRGTNSIIDFFTTKATQEMFESQLLHIYDMVKDK